MARCPILVMKGIPEGDKGELVCNNCPSRRCFEDIDLDNPLSFFYDMVKAQAKELNDFLAWYVHEYKEKK